MMCPNAAKRADMGPSEHLRSVWSLSHSHRRPPRARRILYHLHLSLYLHSRLYTGSLCHTKDFESYSISPIVSQPRNCAVATAVTRTAGPLGASILYVATVSARLGTVRAGRKKYLQLSLEYHRSRNLVPGSRLLFSALVHHCSLACSSLYSNSPE